MMGSHFLVFNSIGNVPKIKVVFMLCYANDWSALLRLSSAVSSFKNRCNCTHTALRIYWDWIAQTASRGDHWCMWLHIQCSVNANCLHARAVESTPTLHNMHITSQVVCLRKRQCFGSRFTGGDTKLHFLFLFFLFSSGSSFLQTKKKKNQMCARKQWSHFKTHSDAKCDLQLNFDTVWMQLVWKGHKTHVEGLFSDKIVGHQPQQ